MLMLQKQDYSVKRGDNMSRLLLMEVLWALEKMFF